MSDGVRRKWAKRVARWLASGLTYQEFSAGAGLNPRTLKYWRWRLAHDEGAPASTALIPVASPPAFVEVSPAAMIAATHTLEPEAADELEVVLLDGLRVRVPPRFDADALRRVVVTLETR
jgi:hypothetical protein